MDTKDRLFTSIVYLFFSSGMQGLGQMPHPVDESLRIDLSQAEESIQILELLEEKTQGNLSEELSIQLKKYLNQLKSLYAQFSQI